MRRQRGFTLIEVLLATLLLASAIAVTAASVRGIARAQQRSEAALAESSARNGVQAWLRARIGATLPVAFVDASQGRVLFIGRRDRMEFVTELPPYPTLTGPVRQVIEAQSAGASGYLICVSQALPDAATPVCSADEQSTLVRGLSRVEFRYRGRNEAGAAGPWLPEWKRGDILPEWVEVRMGSPADAPAWPQLVVHIPVAINPAP